ncbi:unnamed protein product [Adineta steineri]|uniref:Trehalase n=1 Tax=Adineta steineri TaxID=433720 RepID=A0A818VVV1_9BILA|nr:unnamed protein product [Adineta steineri]CAF3716535.1 unnamed protein product [Adineta steineri]
MTVVVFIENFSSDLTISTVAHINRLWDILTRPPDIPTLESSKLSTLSHKLNLIENMIDNFVNLIDKYGFIPNRNRTYYLNRSQSPVFTCMIDLLSNFNFNLSNI